MRKSNHKNDIPIYAAALQDHYSRHLTKNVQKLLKLPPILSRNSKALISQNAKIVALNDPEYMKMHKYQSKLTLAQKIGLIPSPPQPLNKDAWNMIEEQARKRKEGEGLCPICLEAFKGIDQIILSCSHMFHKNCLVSFEKLCKIKMCPICRKQDYDKRDTDQGFVFYRLKCVIFIQRMVRGYLVRKWFYVEILVPRQKELVSKLLKRKVMSFKLRNIGKRIDKNMIKKNKVSEEMLGRMEKAIHEKTQMIYNDLQSLQYAHAKKEENQEKVLEIVWGQYEKNLENIKNKGHNQEEIMKEWGEIKKKGIERCGEDCAICLNKLFVQKKPLYLLSCSHIFHTHCIEALERYDIQEKKKCPICREVYQKMSFLSQKQKFL